MNPQGGEIQGSILLSGAFARGPHVRAAADDMETLASFPTVQAAEVAAVTAEAVACPPSAAAPRPTGESLTRHTSARSARVVRLPPRSITVLSVVAAAVWAAVWWIERQRGLEDTAVQTAHATPVETVTR